MTEIPAGVARDLRKLYAEDVRRASRRMTEHSDPDRKRRRSDAAAAAGADREAITDALEALAEYHPDEIPADVAEAVADAVVAAVWSTTYPDAAAAIGVDVAGLTDLADPAASWVLDPVRLDDPSADLRTRTDTP